MIKLELLILIIQFILFFRCAQQQKDLDISRNDMINLIQVWFALRLCFSQSLVLFVVLLLGQTLVCWNRQANGIIFLVYSALFLCQCNVLCRVFSYTSSTGKRDLDDLLITTRFKDTVLPMMHRVFCSSFAIRANLSQSCYNFFYPIPWSVLFRFCLIIGLFYIAKKARVHRYLVPCWLALAFNL